MFKVNLQGQKKQYAFLMVSVFSLCLLIPALQIQAGDKNSEKEMKPYKEVISGVNITFEMVPIPGGKFKMGSPDSEENREESEGPVHEVEVEPFWMGKHEITWDEYDVWTYGLDIQRRKIMGDKTTDNDKLSDAITKPTKPYVDMTFGMGHDGYPAICMTQLAAKMYCKWLTKKTGHYYRLPTEAEWEYACRAGTSTPYSFGKNADDIDDYAWHYDNSDETYHKVGKKKPNPWGLYDMHGNVSEWVLDQFDPNYYKTFKKGVVAKSPLNVPVKLFPRIVKGGSWDDDPPILRSAARIYSEEDWKMQEPKLPQSIWYHTDAQHVGFRIIRPLNVPSEEVRKKLKLEPLDDEVVKERD